jgi:hypothetical protein
VGKLRSWSESVELLARAGRLEPALVGRVRWLERFGQLIANSDMHFANLSFFTRGERVLDLTPTYDMVPMLYAPQQGHLPGRTFLPPAPASGDAALWASVCRAASDFWAELGTHPLVSRSFARIARSNHATVKRLESLASHLPT